MVKPPRNRRKQRARKSAHGRRDGPAILYGMHAVTAALSNPNRIPIRLTVTRNALARLRKVVDPLPVDPQVAEPASIEAIVQGSVHQGIVLEAEQLQPTSLDDLSDVRLVVVLDQITDPQNVGAILRSANALGADAVITTARHSPEATGTMAKAACGALEWTPYVTIGNLATGLVELRNLGFYIVGFDSDAPQTLPEAIARLRPDEPLALVLGAEGRGLRQLTRQKCDCLVRLDMPGRIKSLNVSNAAALGLYIAGGRRG